MIGDFGYIIIELIIVNIKNLKLVSLQPITIGLCIGSLPIHYISYFKNNLIIVLLLFPWEELGLSPLGPLLYLRLRLTWTFYFGC